MRSLLILSILFCTPVWACESYEECMQDAKKMAINSCLMGCDGDSCDDTCKDTDFTWHFFESVDTSYKGFIVFYLKSIAYKLDEIHKEILDYEKIERMK